MSKKATALWASLVLATVAVLVADWRGGYRVSLRHGIYWAPPPNESSVEKSGLRLSVTGVRRSGGEVMVAYRFDYLPSSGPFAMCPCCLLDAHFWDEDGNRLGGPSEFVFFTRELVREHHQSFKGETTFNAPKGAAYVSVGLETDGLMTRKVAIPAR